MDDAMQSPALGAGGLLFDGPEWNFELVQRVYDACAEIALGEMGLDIYPNQIEVITAEQMLDAYTSIGMPLMYRHWSFGKRFAREETLYRKGHRALAYELVINSNPCINYIMEENTMTMQLLVIAHAAFGHNHFFKNNYLFQQWTRADAILDYLDFAKNYVSKCEEKYGIEKVEQVLDWAHALMSHGVHRYIGPRRQSADESRARSLARLEYEEATYNDLWRTVPKGEDGEGSLTRGGAEASTLGLPEENILYFLEKHAPKLADWQRELLRIVRRIAEYLHPQRQTKVMNEGCATFTHFEILNRLYDRGRISEGSMLEFLHSHSSVVFQPGFRDRRFGGMNPYALGFEMMRDIKRMVEEPTAEDREWFPDLAGTGDSMAALREIWADYRDESFVHQYLSPKLIRDFRFFTLEDDAEEDDMEVSAIHDEAGYRRVRRALAKQYDVAAHDPRIEVVEANLSGNRRLLLRHTVINERLLSKSETEQTLQCLANLWGHRVKLLEVCAETDDVLVEHDALPRPS
ncbi:MAG: SpoVR family protein [Neomegalonema sp.]|nr:SpoVR family protein [Neomegalonema sp.]